MHIYPLGMKEVHARTTMKPPTPVTPEELCLPDDEWMQEYTHLPRLRGLAAIPLTLVAQRTGTAIANAGSIHDTQTAIDLSALFMRDQRAPSRTPQGPIRLERKVGASETASFPRRVAVAGGA